MTAKEDREKEKTRRENLSKFIYQLANGLLLRKVGENGLKIYSFSTSPSLLQRYGLRYGNINYTGGRRSCYYDMFEKLGI